MMMNTKRILTGTFWMGTLVLLPALSGCASVGSAAENIWNWDVRGNQAAAQPGTSRVAPLVVPPDFALVPAQVPSSRQQDGGQDQVLEAMFGGAAARPASERAVTSAAGTSEVGIRTAVGDPETNTVNKGSVTRDIIAAPEGDGQTAQSVIPG